MTYLWTQCTTYSDFRNKNESFSKPIFSQPLRIDEKAINKEIIVHVLKYTPEKRNLLVEHLVGSSESVILNNFLES